MTAPDMTLWELPVGRELVRFSIRSWQGRTFAELRRWYRAGDDGDGWRHGAKGCTMPLEALTGLHAAIGEHLDAQDRRARG